jgi:hypothetical protein
VRRRGEKGGRRREKEGEGRKKGGRREGGGRKDGRTEGPTSNVRIFAS